MKFMYTKSAVLAFSRNICRDLSSFVCVSLFVQYMWKSRENVFVTPARRGKKMAFKRPSDFDLSVSANVKISQDCNRIFRTSEKSRKFSHLHKCHFRPCQFPESLSSFRPLKIKANLSVVTNKSFVTSHFLKWSSVFNRCFIFKC